MSPYKVIFTGPSGAGKTTAINALSDIPTIKTDEVASDVTRLKKEKITVAMDYGVLKLSEQEKVHLYGTPGQERFDFMWEILTEGGLGLILLIDNTRRNCFEDIHFFLKKFDRFVEEKKVVVGISQMDLNPTPTLEQHYQNLEKMGINDVPIFEIDARQKRDVYLLLQILLVSLDPFLKH